MREDPSQNDSPSPPPSSEVDRSDSRVSNIPNVIVGSVKPKLPKLHIAKYSGEMMKFRTFWDSFNSAVNQNSALSAVDKFNYLHALLEGQAATAIQGLTLSEAHYSTALEILKEHFGKTQPVISTHMDQLHKIPTCAGDKASQIQAVYDKISVHVRGLEALGIRAKQCGSFLIPVIMSKLPSEIRQQVATVSTQKVWKLL